MQNTYTEPTDKKGRQGDRTAGAMDAPYSH